VDRSPDPSPAEPLSAEASSAEAPSPEPLSAEASSAEPLSAEPLSAEALPPSDADLIAASRTGDAAAYAILYQRHVAAAHGLARQLVRGQAEADDVVAETFAKVLDLLRRGGGPDGAFRPYLLTAVRRAAYDRHRAERRQVVTDEMEAFDPGVPFADPAVADLERTMIARAFASLPERWQAVLWHTEIEGARPAEVASLLGLTANGVAALAYRAREGLRQAYLQMHLSGAVRDECRPVAAKLGAYVRGGLAKRDAATVADHLDQCADCQRIFAELGDVNVALKGIVAPIVLGPAAAAYLASAAVKGSAGGWIAGRLTWFRHAPKGQQAAAAVVAAAAVIGLAAMAMALTGHTGPAPGPATAHRAVPPAAAPAPAPAGTSAPAASKSSGRASGGSGPPGSAVPGSGPPASGPAAPGPRPGTSSQPAQRQHASPPSPSSAPATSAPAVNSAPAVRSAPAVSSAPAPRAKLATRINPVGTLPPGGTGIVAFTVTNTSAVIAAQVNANVTLPAGVSYLTAGTLGMTSMDRASPGGWTCGPAARGATCTHGPLAAGASTTSYLQVVVASDAPEGVPPGIAVDDGGRPVSARGTAGVSAGGFPARFAASGRFAVVTADARLGAGCETSAWDWQPAPPRCGGGQASATLTLPGPVVWAGLYWAWAGGGSQAAIGLRGPAGTYRQVAGNAAGASVGPGLAGLPGIAVYQAFADVTGLVSRYGGGTWTATPGNAPAGAGATAGSPGQRDDGGVSYLGWTLVVVTADGAAPSGQVMVLDGVRPVDASDSGFSAPLGGLLAGQAVQVHVVAWTEHGPQASAFTLPLVGRPAVSFAAAAEPYLVGVIAATDS
jgi:RNA polymerase sigma factor (sigma-70 family)